MREVVFYVGESFILRVRGGPGAVKFRGVFQKRSKVRLGESLFEIFAIFGCPSGPRMPQF